MAAADQHPLRHARQRAGLSMRALGAKARIAYTRIWQIENGLPASGRELHRLAKALSVDVTSLVIATAEESAHV